jgi:hypothetical protein
MMLSLIGSLDCEPRLALRNFCLFTVTTKKGVDSTVLRIGYNVREFLMFCDNHPKPFGFKWTSSLEDWKMNPQCPKCGSAFKRNAQLDFMLIITGFVSQQDFDNCP